MVIAIELDMDRIRKTRAFRIDEALISGLNELAKRQNISANRLVENILFDLLREKGVLPDDIQPLGETRGGDQKAKERENE